MKDQVLDLCALPKLSSQERRFQSTSIESLYHMVIAGMGYTILPVLARPTNPAILDAVVTRPLEPKGLGRWMVLYYRKGSPKHLWFKQFQQECQSLLQQKELDLTYPSNLTSMPKEKSPPERRAKPR